MADYTITFDGGCRAGNPGLGYGSYVISGQVPARLEFDTLMTSNEAEYHALIAALHGLLQQVGSKAGEMFVEVWGDSRLVVNQINGRWRVRNSRMQELCGQAQSLLVKFGDWEMGWQPREESVGVLGH